MKHHDGVCIYVLIDALGWEILRDRPFLDDIIQDRHRVETILGYSSGAIPSLLTGQYPNAHGHWNLFYRAAMHSPFGWTSSLQWLPSRVREWRGTRRLIKEVSKRLSGYSGYFAIYNVPVDRLAYYDLCETRDIYQPGGLAPARSLFDVLSSCDVPYACYTYHTHTDAEILAQVPTQIRETDCRVYFLYLSQLDAYLHFHVDDTHGVTERLRQYEDGLRQIYRTAVSRWGAARLLIFSDHGMTPIQHTYDLIREVERLPLRIPDDYLPAYDSTMARFWIHREHAETRLRDLLSGLPYGRLLSACEHEQLGIAFDDHRYGHLIFLLNPGGLICPSDMGRIRFAGMHGFHPQEDAAAYAVCLSSEPQPTPITHITEIFPVVLSELQLT